MKTKCKACKGTGWDNRSACMNCNGSGLKLKKEFPDPTSQLQADKEELLEAVTSCHDYFKDQQTLQFGDFANYLESLIQKHKKCGTA